MSMLTALWWQTCSQVISCSIILGESEKSRDKDEIYSHLWKMRVYFNNEKMSKTQIWIQIKSMQALSKKQQPKSMSQYSGSNWVENKTAGCEHLNYYLNLFLSFCQRSHRQMSHSIQSLRTCRPSGICEHILWVFYTSSTMDWLHSVVFSQTHHFF